MKKPLLLTLITSILLTQPAYAREQVNDYLDMDLQDLLSMEVTSVSRKKQRLSEAATAVFVISHEDIRRSGVTSIPDALRMVPGLHVTKIDSNKWSISSRGFNGRFANKLLVLMDGRSVYTSIFAGVYWEMQDYLLEDVERIEVIRGPGATLWGANAVNGVINIITKKTEETQGVLVTASMGDEEKGSIGVRYGTQLGENSTGRAYFKAFQRDEYVDASGANASDDWDMMQGGFKFDSEISSQDSMTLQGDYYRGDISQAIVFPTLTAPYSTIVQDATDVSGGNLLGRWQHTASPTSQFILQTYFDWYEREEAFGEQTNKTIDFDFQHHLTLEKHDLIWGAGYRQVTTDIDGTFVVNTAVAKREDDLYSFFVQDEVTLVEDVLKLTIGSKFEHNDYSGSELQPSLRLIWSPAENHTVWGSISRAVRTPSRLDHELNISTLVIPPLTPTNPSPLPVAVTAFHNPDFNPEQLWAWELGYRVKPATNLSFDLALFYNDYDQLRTIEPGVPVFEGTHVVQPVYFQSDLKGTTYGLELASIWQPLECWQLNLAYSYIESEYDHKDPFDELFAPVAPRHQLSLRSITDLSETLDLDLWIRYVDESQVTDAAILSLTKVDSYITFDARLAWRPYRNTELSLVGQNLLDSQHLEAIQETFTLPTEVERSLFIKLRQSF